MHPFRVLKLCMETLLSMLQIEATMAGKVKEVKLRYLQTAPTPIVKAAVVAKNENRPPNRCDHSENELSGKWSP